MQFQEKLLACIHELTIERINPTFTWPSVCGVKADKDLDKDLDKNLDYLGMVILAILLTIAMLVIFILVYIIYKMKKTNTSLPLTPRDSRDFSLALHSTMDRPLAPQPLPGRRVQRMHRVHRSFTPISQVSSGSLSSSDYSSHPPRGLAGGINI